MYRAPLPLRPGPKAGLASATPSSAGAAANRQAFPGSGEGMAMHAWRPAPAVRESFPPRERIFLAGASPLSDQDLLQILLGTGTRETPVEDLALRVRDVLDRSTGYPDPLVLRQIRGVGPAKAALLCAAVEFARRRFLPEQARIRCARDAWLALRHLADRPQEVFLTLRLNGAHEVQGIDTVSVGTLNRTLVHPREVFARAVELRAAAVMVAHTHPSGCLDPSPEDHEVTRRLADAGEVLGIPVLDHLVISGQGYFSFLSEGLM